MLFLTQEQIAELTERRTRKLQKEALNYMGIVYKERKDGSLAVAHAHVQKEFGCIDRRIEKLETPDFGALNA